jgi:hypothetical protein
MIVECNVWCVGIPQEQIDLGLPEGDSWMPIAVDFSTISHIKLAGENEFLGPDKACVYIHGLSFTLDIRFADAIELWKEALKCG